MVQNQQTYKNMLKLSFCDEDHKVLVVLPWSEDMADHQSCASYIFRCFKTLHKDEG